MSRALFCYLTAVRVSILLLIIWVAGEKVMGSPVLLARNCHDILAGGCSSAVRATFHPRGSWAGSSGLQNRNVYIESVFS
jgi:hypothetical protein